MLSALAQNCINARNQSGKHQAAALVKNNQ